MTNHQDATRIRELAIESVKTTCDNICQTLSKLQNKEILPSLKLVICIIEDAKEMALEALTKSAVAGKEGG